MAEITENSLPPLNKATLWGIIRQEISDEVVNALIAYYLGYRCNGDRQGWDLSSVEPSWAQEYPEPPNFIENRPPTVKLTRSIPAENKQLLKEQLGFTGYRIGEFTPRHTRRATAVNWLLSYMVIHGIPLT
ncbi:MULTISPECIES: DUF1823 family protein [unclassified Synechocystis]|uniref:DUF1823 family protein n=1 Tax=unclassified Synechocystis TaxID=2640012 RepID=UPI0003FDE4FF|nr:MULTISPECIES: DUF1823 family protein [unclassified Synechocystis]AIE72752.1 hypothetical protein D082_02230 [Synechocystis sp. PCC 6714]MCT0254603.1 DUF1823 family protein [Synechocystis sp. CS-94]